MGRLDFFPTPVAFMSLLPECHAKHAFRCDVWYFYHTPGVIVTFSIHSGFIVPRKCIQSRILPISAIFPPFHHYLVMIFDCPMMIEYFNGLT